MCILHFIMSLEIEATVKTPKISVDSNQGRILLAGISIPEDPHEFYVPLNEAVESYLEKPANKTDLEFQLEYFNTSTTLIIRNLIRKLGSLGSSNNFCVKWYYERDDEDMEEAGGEFKLLFPELNFDLIAIDELPNNQ